MGTASEFNKILKEQLNIYAAWLPVTNIFSVGDYGLMTDGVFTRIGNIETDFAVPTNVQEGPRSTLSFNSAGVSIARATVAADGKIPGAEGGAKLVVQFAKQQEFMLRATLTRVDMDSVATTAARLARTPRWQRR